jgi:flagellar biogenesis protein FliO
MSSLKKTWTLFALLAVLPIADAVAQDADTIAPATYEAPAQQQYMRQAEVGVDRSAGEPPVVRQPTPVPLRRPETLTEAARQSQDKKGNSTFTVIGSLGLVLGLFFAVTWIFRRGMPGGMFLLPREALEVLGKAALGSRQQVQLIRVGHKLLLVAITPAGVQTLTEITDPNEIERLTRICNRTAPGTTDAKSKGDASRRPARAKGGRRVAAKPSDVFEPSLTGGRNA